MHYLLLLLFSTFCFADPTYLNPQERPIVLSSKMIQLDDYPDAYNPSIIKYGEGYLLAFRDQPDMFGENWISYIGLVLLNDQFEPISTPQRINARPHGGSPSQTEDARLITNNGKIYLLYNDNPEVTNPYLSQRRDMYLAELHEENGIFSISEPLRLFCEEKSKVLWQKNWVPFTWNGMLLLSYSISPHEVLFPNLQNGECYLGYRTSAPINWPLGILRGGTPAQLVDGEYLSFFHSGTVMYSGCSKEWQLWHYFMGAYTFSSEPPFEITKISQKPIVGEGFYTPSRYFKRVIFPSGYIVDGSLIHVTYGKDDSELWVATLDKDALLDSLISVYPK